jgi:hypothetical protein
VILVPRNECAPGLMLGICGGVLVDCTAVRLIGAARSILSRSRRIQVNSNTVLSRYFCTSYHRLLAAHAERMLSITEHPCVTVTERWSAIAAAAVYRSSVLWRTQWWEDAGSSSVIPVIVRMYRNVQEY